MVHHREEDRIGIPFPNHSSDVLCSLNEQRRAGLLCDVVLIVRDQEYRSHRSVLAACSHYFKKLFTVANCEDGRHHRHHAAAAAAAAAPSAAIYEIDFVAPESLTAILEFAYTSTLTVTASNVGEILNAAQMLEIPCIINVCLEIMDSGGGRRGGGPEGRGEEEVEEDEEEEEEEDGSRNDEREDDDDGSSESRGEPLGTDESPPPGTSAYQERSPDGTHAKQENLENRALKDFSIESLLQDGLYPRMSALDRRASFSPLLPGFYPSMWAADFPAFPKHFLEPGLHQHSRAGDGSPRVPATYPTPDAPPPGPLNLAVKREIIKEEMKEEALPGLLHGNFLKEFVSSGLCGAMSSTGPVAPSDRSLGVVKDEPDFRSYLSFLNSASHIGALFPPWQLEEERKIKPKSSQQCPICNKIIQGAGKLPRHMRTHTGEKPYMCTICEVRFTRQDKLKIHMRKHTGERPYICLHCNSKFVHNYDLKNHLRIHTGVRPYQCEHCYKSFTRSDHLHRHLKRQSCRVSRPRRGRKPTAWRSAPTAGYLCPPDAAGVLEGNGFKSYHSVEEKDAAERQRGVFAFALDDALARSPFYAAASDPWTVRLERAPPIPESAT